MRRKIEKAKRKNQTEVLIDSPPNFILVILLDNHGNIRRREDFPLDLDHLEDCSNTRIVIPIALN